MAAPFDVKLKPRERYAGVVLAGSKAHHLVLLPETGEAMAHKDAADFAATSGGELPTKAEMLVISANLPAVLRSDQYWLAAPAVDSPTYGDVFDARTLSAVQQQMTNTLRAICVRRVPVEA